MRFAIRLSGSIKIRESVRNIAFCSNSARLLPSATAGTLRAAWERELLSAMLRSSKVVQGAELEPSPPIQNLLCGLCRLHPDVPLPPSLPDWFVHTLRMQGVAAHPAAEPATQQQEEAVALTHPQVLSRVSHCGVLSRVSHCGRTCTFWSQVGDPCPTCSWLPISLILEGRRAEARHRRALRLAHFVAALPE